MVETKTSSLRGSYWGLITAVCRVRTLDTAFRGAVEGFIGLEGWV